MKNLRFPLLIVSLSLLVGAPVQAEDYFGVPAVAVCRKNLPTTPLTVNEAVDLALCRHPQTREVWAAARAQAAQLGVARSAWLPDLDAKLNAQRRDSDSRGINQRSGELSLSWLLYDFGQREASVDNARQLLNAALATQDAMLQTVFLVAMQNFYAAQAAAAAVDAALQAERAAQQSLAAAQARYSVGAVTPADRLQAQTALSQATLNRIRAEGEAKNAQGALAYALGFSAPQTLVLAPAARLPSVAAFQRAIEQLIADAVQRRPDLRAADAQWRAAAAAVELAKAQGRPSITLGAGPTWQTVGGIETHGSSAGVTLSVPIFSGFETTWRVRQAEAQRELRQAQRDRLENQVALDVWKAYQNLTTANQTLAATADLLASAEQSAKVALGRYQAGVGTLLDLLTAQAAQASARQQRIQAELDWNVSRASLAQALGILDISLLQMPGEGKE